MDYCRIFVLLKYQFNRMKQFLSSIILFLLISSKAFGQPGEIDPAFNPMDIGFGNGDGISENGRVYSAMILPNGKIFITGAFEVYNRNATTHIAVLTSDGAPDTSFHSGFNMSSGTPNTAALQNDGKILLGGSFTDYDGFSRNCIVRIHPSGEIDTTFDVGSGIDGVNKKINAIVIQPNGKIIIAGEFTSYNGVTRNRIARLNPDGSLDMTFNTSGSGLNGTVYSLAIDGNQGIIVGGNFTTCYGISQNGITYLDGTTGSVNTSFNSGSGAGGNVNIHSIMIQPNGKVLLGGGFTSYNGVAKNGIVRLNQNGTIDGSFDFVSQVTGSMVISEIAMQSDGQIICVVNNAFGGKWISRLSQNGIEDSTFVSGADVWFNLNFVTVQADDRILTGGYNPMFNGSTFSKSQNGITRLNLNGSWDNTFNGGTGFNKRVFSTAVQPDGKILVGGDFTRYNGKRVGYLARLNQDGGLDSTFVQEDLNGNVRAIAIQPDGKIVIGGEFQVTYSGVIHKVLRLNPDGSRDNTFNAINVGGYEVYTIEVDLTGKILVGSHSDGIDRLNPDGSLDNSFIPASTNFSWFSVYCTYPLSDGKYLVGGSFGPTTPYNPLDQDNIRRLLPTGAFDYSFNQGSGANGGVKSMAVQSDGKIIIGGFFTSYNGNPRNYVARINSNGTIDNSFDSGSGADYWVNSVLLLPNGKIVIGGEFSSFNGVPCKGLIRLNADGSVDSSFNAGSGTDYNVYSLSLINSEVIAGGDFVSYNGIGRNRIMRVLNCPPISVSLTGTNATCNGGNDGAVSTTVTGGTAPYSYSWSSIGVTTQNVANLSAGTYQVTITDSEGCIKSGSVIITEPGVNQTITPITSCNSYTWTQTNQTYTVSGLYSDTLSSASNGCDSIISLDLTITNSTSGTAILTTCDSLLWIDGNTYYTSTNTPTFVLQNAAGCDSTVTLNLTIIPSLPLMIENSFSMPADANSCTGEVAVTVSGNSDFEQNFDNGSQVVTSSGYSLVTNLCAGVHDLHVTDNCGDTLSTTIVIPVDSNYVFNNPFIDSLAQDSLGVILTNCDIYYAGIDTAYIDSIWANGNTVNVIWNIVDSDGSNLDTASYVLNNGNGVYWLQLSVFCPFKSVGEYFTVTEAIYFNNGHVSTAGLIGHKELLFEIYPNPTNDQVHITFSGPEAELTVYDVQGKVVFKNQIQNQEIISLQNFERGVYLFDFSNSNGQSIQRVVKQ